MKIGPRKSEKKEPETAPGEAPETLEVVPNMSNLMARVYKKQRFGSGGGRERLIQN